MELVFLPCNSIFTDMLLVSSEIEGKQKLCVFNSCFQPSQTYPLSSKYTL